MKKTKEEKGITLVALIITIVILLILAAVAISAIQNENILGYANNAANTYSIKKDEEQTILNKYESYFEKDDATIGTFTVKNTSTGVVKTYNFIIGQTWEQYFSTNSDFYSNGSSVFYSSEWLTKGINAVNKKDTIVNGCQYTINPDSEWSPIIPV